MKIINILKPLIALVKKPITILLPITLFFAGWWLGLPAKQDNSEGASASESSQEWTCSMHPQIRQPNFGLCPICNMDLIPLEAGNSDGGLREIAVSAEAAALLDLRVSPVLRAPAQVDVKMFGKIDYEKTLLNCMTAGFPEGARVRAVVADEAEGVARALADLDLTTDAARVVKIVDTSNLAKLLASENLALELSTPPSR